MESELSLPPYAFRYFTTSGTEILVQPILYFWDFNCFISCRLRIAKQKTQAESHLLFKFSNSEIGIVDLFNAHVVKAFKEFSKDQIMEGKTGNEPSRSAINWTEIDITSWEEMKKMGFDKTGNILIYKRKGENVDLERQIAMRMILEYLDRLQRPYESTSVLLKELPLDADLFEVSKNELRDLRYIDRFEGADNLHRITAQGREHLRNIRSATNIKSSEKIGREPSMPVTKKLIVFICYASQDQKSADELYNKLEEVGYDPWMDKNKLLPGQDWQREIEMAVQRCHAIIVCLSKTSVTKEGFVQKEIRLALDEADKKPEGTIFIIPLKLEECKVHERHGKWQWVNYFDKNGPRRLSAALQHRLEQLKK